MTTAALATTEYSPERIALLKRTVCRGATDDEFALFVTQCQRTGLDPFARQIHAVKRWDKQLGREVMSIQTGIDGYRLIAERTGLYAGNDDPVYDVEDAEHPNKATVTVWKLVGGQRVSFTRSARWSEFKQTKKGGELTRFWQQMPYLMLGKVAEALALRAAFPQELSGVYTNEEMQQADDNDAHETTTTVHQEPAKQLQGAPIKTPVGPDYSERLKGAKSIIELAAAWNSIPTQHQRALEGLKNQLKAAFTQPQDEPPEADYATDDDDAAPPTYIGRDCAESIMIHLTQLGIDWAEVRDSYGAGLGLADIAGFQALLDLKVTDLLPDQGMKLLAELKRRVAAKRAGKAAATV